MLENFELPTYSNHVSKILHHFWDVNNHLSTELIWQQIILTLLSPPLPNCYTSKCSGPYWSNPPFLIFNFARVPECQKMKKGGLDQYGPEHSKV